jgi:hypothetical protein
MWIINRTLLLITTLIMVTVSSVTLGSTTPFVIQESAPEVSATITPSFDSKVIFRGEELAKSSLEIPLEISYGSFQADVTSSDAKTYAQVNYHASYAFVFDSFFSLTPDLTFYTCPKDNTSDLTYLTAKSLGQSIYRSHLEPGVSATFNIAGIKLKPRYFYDVSLQGSTYELASSYSLPLLTLGTEIDFFSHIGALKQTHLTPSPESLTKSTHYANLGVLVPYQISQSVNLSASWVYTQNSLSLAAPGTSNSAIKHNSSRVGVFSTGLEFRF